MLFFPSSILRPLSAFVLFRCSTDSKRAERKVKMVNGNDDNGEKDWLVKAINQENLPKSILSQLPSIRPANKFAWKKNGKFSFCG